MNTEKVQKCTQFEKKYSLKSIKMYKEKVFDKY